MEKPIFSTGDDKKTLVVQHTFNAPVERVWDAWTNSELLEKWWAPAPWKAVTKTFDFREGGHWHYYMLGPEGDKHWCWVDFLTIDPKKRFTAYDGFCDEDGKRNTELPSNNWENEFIPEGDRTLLRVTLTFASSEDLETIVKMGFKEGFGQGLDQLDEMLKEE